MKHVCVMASNFFEYQVLLPLIREIEHDEFLYITSIISGTHKSNDTGIEYCRVCEQGFVIDEQTRISLSDTSFDVQSLPLEQVMLWDFFTRQRPDLFIVSGSSAKAFQAALIAHSLQINVAHISEEGNISNQWESAWTQGIAKMSRLHFVDSEEKRHEIIKQGEHPDSVFNVGSLLIQCAGQHRIFDRQKFMDLCEISGGIGLRDDFVLVACRPDLDLGSATEEMFLQIPELLERETMTDQKFLFVKQQDSGLGKLVNKLIEDLIARNPKRAAIININSLASMNSAVFQATAIVSNNPKFLAIAQLHQRPVILLEKEAACLKPIQCMPPHLSGSLACRPVTSTFMVNKNMSDSRFGNHPVPPMTTTEKIIQVIKTFDPTDIRPKSHHPASEQR